MESYFHVMNENGYYIGGNKIKLVFFLYKKPIYNKLKGISKGYYQELCHTGELDFQIYFNECYGIKDYISDCIYNSLEYIL